MVKKYSVLGFLMLSLGILGMTAQAMAATANVTIPAGAATCMFDYASTCAYAPNPLTIQTGDSVQWHNAPDTLHTATSDDSGNSTVVVQPVAPANAFSTELMFPAANSTVIGP